MIVHQVFAQICDEEIKNIIVCDNYEMANWLTRASYGDEAFAVDCLQYPCGIGDRYHNGAFYRVNGDGTEEAIQYIPTAEQQLPSINAQMGHLATISGIGVELSASGQTLEELKEAKKSEINAACGQTVCKGITVELSAGLEHFSLSQSDQLNLFGLQAQIASGLQEIVYHADGQPCRFYSASDITILIEKAMFHVSYHVTYANSLKIWIDNIETAEELSNISYGTDIPVQYQSDVFKTYLAQIAAMTEE